MIEIAAANENAVVSQIDDTRSNNTDGFPGFKPSGRAFSSLPSLQTLTISTSTSSVVNNHLKYSGAGNNGDFNDIDNDIDDDNGNGCEFNDCSSSVSSQYSDNANSSRNPHKRSVFSRYWKKTGQKPIPLRPVRPISTPNLLQRIPPGLTQERSPLQATADSPGSTSAYSDNDCLAIRSMSNSDFLEYDGDSSCHDVPASRQVILEFPVPQAPSPSLRSRRRRSILPQAPRSHPALKSTIANGSQSWRKSLSLSSVEEYSRTKNPSFNMKHKTQSLPGMRSTGSHSRPLNSCFRPDPKYSPSKSDSASRKRLDPLLLSSSHKIPESGHSSSFRPGLLSRTESCSSGSSVSFLEVVDVQHFEPPRQMYAGQGWSDYFK